MDVSSTVFFDSIRQAENKDLSILKSELLQKFAQYAPLADQTKLSEALTFGEAVHAHQKRETGVPYFTHPLIVGLLMVDYQPSLELLIATVLHDAIEDSEWSDIRTQITDRFGEEVTHLIESVSHVRSMHGPKTLDFETLQKIFLFTADDTRTLLIKVFDRLHNIITLSGKKSKAKQEKKINETLKIYLPAAKLLGMGKIVRLLENTCFAHLFPVEVKEIESRIQQALVQGEKMKQKFLDVLAQSPCPDAKIDILPKSFWSISTCRIEDVLRSHLYAIRIETNSDAENYAVLKFLNKTFRARANTLEDFVKNPKENGYRAIHNEYIVDSATRVMVHIVSSEEKRQNETGVFVPIAQKDYKMESFESPYIHEVFNDSTDFQLFLTGDLLVEKIPLHAESIGEFKLPQGVCLLDALVYLHPKDFVSVASASINGIKQELYTPLKKDDIVKFSFSEKESVFFDEKWFEYASIYHTKKTMRDYAKSRTKEVNVKIGKNLLERAFDTAKEGGVPILFLRKLHVQKKFDFYKIEELYQKVGADAIRATDVLEYFWKISKNLGGGAWSLDLKKQK